MSRTRDLAILTVAGLCAAYFIITSRPIEHAAGILVANDPEQSPPDHFTPVVKGDFTLQPRARIAADVRILSRERYYLGKLADVARLDIAVGWGPMSDSAVLAAITISQGQRFYVWHYENEPPIPRAVIETHSANWHVVAATDAIWQALRRLRVGDIVRLQGLLVDIEHTGMETMRTSLIRDDTGAGACEVVYVESVSVAGG